MCRKLTSPWNRLRAKEDQSSSANQIQDIENVNNPTCKFFEKFDSERELLKLHKDVYTLDDLKEKGRELGVCPYFLARRFLL